MMIYVFHGFGCFIFLSEARMVLNRHIHQRLERFCTLRISDRSACPLLQIVAARYADTWRSLIDRFRIPSATTFRPESMNFLRPDEFHKRCFPGNPQLLVIACYSPYMPIPSIDLHFPRRAPCGFVWESVPTVHPLVNHHLGGIFHVHTRISQ